MLQKEAATGTEAGVETGGEACDVSGDVGQHFRTGLVVVGDLGGQKMPSKAIRYS